MCSFTTKYLKVFCTTENMAFKLCFEPVGGNKGSDDSISKKEETYKMAESYRAFAHSLIHEQDLHLDHKRIKRKGKNWNG